MEVCLGKGPQTHMDALPLGLAAPRESSGVQWQGRLDLRHLGHLPLWFVPQRRAYTVLESIS